MMLCLRLILILFFSFILGEDLEYYPEITGKFSIKDTRLSTVNCGNLNFAWAPQMAYKSKVLHKTINESVIRENLDDFFNTNNTYCIDSVENKECNPNEGNKDEEIPLNQPQIGGENSLKEQGPERCIRNHRNFFYKQIFLCDRFPINKDNGTEPNSNQVQFLRDYIKNIVLRYCSNIKLNDEYMHNFIDFLFLLKNSPRVKVCDTVHVEKEQNEDCFENQNHDNIVYTCYSRDPKDMSESFFTYFYDKIDANNPASDVLSLFNELRYDTTEAALKSEQLQPIIHNLATIIKEVPEIKTQMKVLDAINIPLSRELMISNLLLNSYGKALRNVKKRLSIYCKEASPKLTINLKQFEPECIPESLYQRTPYTLGITDFDELILYENIRVVIRIFLLLLSLLVNAYTLFIVHASALEIPYVSSKLIKLLLVSNFLFIITDFLVILDSLIPFARQDEYLDFIAMTNFDGDLWENVTYYVNMETVRNTLYYRYDNQSEVETEATLASTWANFNIIIQTFLLNISRTYSAIILLFIVCYVLYELRNSFSGRLSQKTTMCFKLTLFLCFSIVTVGYVIAGVLQYFVIDYINQSIKTDNRTVICEQAAIKSYQIRIHTYMMTTFYILSTLTTFIVFAYHKLQEIVAPVVTKELKSEMRSTMISLGAATAVYIFSNFFTTYTELALTLGSSHKMDNVTIATLTTWYQWLYLASFADPIIHPFILIYRIKAMRITHRYWKTQLTSFSFSEWFVNFVIYIHQYPQRKKTKNDYKRFNGSGKNASHAAICDTMRHRRSRMHSFQLDHDVNSMLSILEKQKNASYLL